MVGSDAQRAVRTRPTAIAMQFALRAALICSAPTDGSAVKFLAFWQRGTNT